MLEVGCGTGQLTNFLGISCRQVIGADLCLNSLRLGEQFRREHGLDRVRFVQMNLFRPCFKPEQFDVVLCNGVLHHTRDPYGGFQRPAAAASSRAGTSSSASTTRYGRLDDRPAPRDVPPDRRPRQVARSVSCAAARSATASARRGSPTSTGIRTSRSTRSARCWMVRRDRSRVRPRHSPRDARRRGRTARNLFEPHRAGTSADHFLVQAKQIVTGSREGGFFLMAGPTPDGGGRLARRPSQCPRRETAGAVMAMIKINDNPSTRDLRQFAGIWFPASLRAVGPRSSTCRRPMQSPAVLGGPRMLVGAVGLQAGLHAADLLPGCTPSYPVGWAISHLLLAVIFFGVMTPARPGAASCSAMIRCGAGSTGAPATYWVPHDPGGTPPATSDNSDRDPTRTRPTHA